MSIFPNLSNSICQVMMIDGDRDQRQWSWWMIFEDIRQFVVAMGTWIFHDSAFVEYYFWGFKSRFDKAVQTCSWWNWQIFNQTIIGTLELGFKAKKTFTWPDRNAQNGSENNLICGSILWAELATSAVQWYIRWCSQF